MEFRYRATDEKRSTFTPESSDYSYFTEQALRAGYLVGPGHSWPGFCHPYEYNRNPIEMREAIWRELEKERIREEIIAEEIARRRMLEDDVRRQLMIEREFAMRRGGDGICFPSTPNLLWPSALPLSHWAEGWSLEGRMSMLLEERLGMSAMLRSEFGGFDSGPFQPQSSSAPRISEVKPASEISKEKEKIVFVAKPEANPCGVKRKPETPTIVDSNELRLAAAPEKKVREEWSCALCQVSSTSERDFSEHLKGKRHKAKEAGLRKNGKDFSIGLYPKNTVKPKKLADIANNPSSEQGMNIVLEADKLGQALLQKETNSESAKGNSVPLLTKSEQPEGSLKNNEIAVQRKRKTKKHKKKKLNNKAAVQRKQKTEESKKKILTFWCEMCKVGAHSEKVMEAHRTGKKHIKKLREANQNAGAEPSTQIVQATQELNLAGEASKDGVNAVSENAYGGVGGIELEAHQKGDEYAESNHAGKSSKDGGNTTSENADSIVGVISSSERRGIYEIRSCWRAGRDGENTLSENAQEGINAVELETHQK